LQKNKKMKLLRILLAVLIAIIFINAVAGGYYGMTGAENVPIEWLKGSPFKSYFIPSLFLFVIIGGSCAIASVALFRNSQSQRFLSLICGFLLLGWIVIQLAIIGYVSWMQPAILISALIIIYFGTRLPKTASHAK
jgi:hypothetical protein